MVLKTIRLGLGEIYYLELGQGPTLLFLHGAMATSEAYLPLFNLLSSHYHIIAPVHPGHGLSAPIPQNWKLNDLISYYEDLLRELNFNPELLIGHSFGGTVALLLAADGFGKRGIVMDSPVLPFDFRPTSIGQAAAKEIAEFLSLKHERAQIEEVIKGAQTVLQTISHHAIDFSFLTKQGPKWNVDKKLRKVKIPISILWGERDFVVPLTDGEKLHLLIQGSHLTVFPGLGHYYPVTDPDFTYKEIIKALEL